MEVKNTVATIPTSSNAHLPFGLPKYQSENDSLAWAREISAVERTDEQASGPLILTLLEMVSPGTSREAKTERGGRNIFGNREHYRFADKQGRV
jgi:hypothetical protein